MTDFYTPSVVHVHRRPSAAAGLQPGRCRGDLQQKRKRRRPPRLLPKRPPRLLRKRQPSPLQQERAQVYSPLSQWRAG